MSYVPIFVASRRELFNFREKDRFNLIFAYVSLLFSSPLIFKVGQRREIRCLERYIESLASRILGK